MSQNYAVLPGPPGSAPHCFKIATLHSSNDSGYDQLHIVANLNSGWGSASNASIDALFGNRGGFTYSYTGRGIAVSPAAKLVAYSNADSSVDIYLMFQNGFETGSYTVLETTEDIVYASPADLGGVTPSGTLVFDSSSPNYPPAIFSAFNGNVGIGSTAPQAKFHVFDTFGVSAAQATSTAFGNANLVVQSSYGTRTQGVGSALSFAFPANIDGSNLWEQARIIGTPDNLFNGNAAGRLYLQTRALTQNGWLWNNNLLLASDGSTTVGGNLKLTAGTGASMTYQDGTVQSTAWNGVLQGGDYAESVDVSGDRAQYAPGDVLVVDPAAEGRFLKSSQPYSTAVMGIYSTRPGVVGRRQKSDRSHMAEEVPMAMIGVVPTKVTAEGGPIKPGDLLVTSSTPGYAMRGTDRSLLTGAIIGKALGHLNSGKGLIEVAVSLQ